MLRTGGRAALGEGGLKRGGVVVDLDDVADQFVLVPDDVPLAGLVDKDVAAVGVAVDLDADPDTPAGQGRHVQRSVRDACVRGDGCTANTQGRFVLTRSPLALSAGTHRLTVVFRPTQTAYYTTVTTTVLVGVNPRHLTLGLTGLTTTPHGQSVAVTVLQLIPGAKVTLGLQASGGPATYTHVLATGARVSVALR